jgi:hypothetical protein
MVEMYGENGRFWLPHLPQLLNKLTERWQLTRQSPIKGMIHKPAIRVPLRPLTQKRQVL